MNGMSASFLAHGTLRNRSWRNCERHRTWMTPRKLCFPDIRVWCRYGLKKCSNMHRASTGLCEIQSRFWLMWTQILSVAQKLTTIDKHLQKKFSFSNKVTVLCKEHWRADVANTKKKNEPTGIFGGFAYDACLLLIYYDALFWFGFYDVSGNS